MSTVCPGCGTGVRLRKNGTLALHHRNGKACPASGTWPTGSGPEACASCAAHAASVGNDMRVYLAAWHARRHPRLRWVEP